MGFKVLTFLALRFIFIHNLQSPIFAEIQRLPKLELKYCRVEKSSEEVGFVDCARKVNSNTTEVKCVVGTDRIDCMRFLVNGQVDFMIAQPEDLIVLGMNEENNNEVRITHLFKLDEKASGMYKWIAVARTNIKNVQQVQKKRYCAPDGDMNFHTQYYTKYFENNLFTPECDPRKTLLENRMSALSTNFETACINIPWTLDYELDTKLKRKYNNLCTCYVSTNCKGGKALWDREYIFSCLHYTDSDIGWTTLKTAEVNFEDKELEQKYQYLCKDGTTRNISQGPCIWIKEPFRSIITRPDKVLAVTRLIYDQDDQNGFLGIIHNDTALKQKSKLVITNRPVTPNYYLQAKYPAFYSLKYNLQCKPDNRKIKWCVVTKLEVEKCKWLSYAAKSYGVEPLIKCVKEDNQKKCLESVRDGRSDIVSKSFREVSNAQKKGLKPVIHMVSNKDHENEVAAIVRKVTHFKSPMEFKGLKACFGGYRDAGWNTFIYTMKKLTGNEDWYRNDTKMISDFFSEVCVISLSKRNSSFPGNLYSFCDNISGKEKGINVAGCFHAGADVAFAEMNVNMTRKPEFLLKTYMKPLCLNKSRSDLTQMGNCFSAWKILGSVMVRKNISKVREEDIFLMLMELDKLFGVTYQGPTPLFSLYAPFGGKRSVLFAKDTKHLERNVCSNPCDQSYEEVLVDLGIINKIDSSDGSDYLKQKVYFVIFLAIINFWFY